MLNVAVVQAEIEYRRQRLAGEAEEHRRTSGALEPRDRVSVTARGRRRLAVLVGALAR